MEINMMEIEKMDRKMAKESITTKINRYIMVNEKMTKRMGEGLLSMRMMTSMRAIGSMV